jgi:hypothetical protein
VPLDRDVILYAFPSDDWRFDKWTAGPCNGSKSAACIFEPSLVMIADVKFRKD